MDQLPDLDPAAGEIEDVELALTDDVLVKAFALGPGAAVDAHEHADATNVFQLLAGTVTVTRGDDRQELTAPAVVVNERGVAHGARNDGDRPAVLTATLAPIQS